MVKQLEQRIPSFLGIDGLEQPETAEIDEGKLEHGTVVVQEANSSAVQAIQQVHGVSISSAALKSAQGVMSKARLL
ncbi:hypothetical protein FRC10_004877 [Ceratobasidium sp. 414]|nr:hypothetical protein FRC10_004877 [Ceratobasidium sp. 414]